MDKVQAIIKQVSNRKLHDKYSVAYFVNMMDVHNFYGTIFVEHNKRQDILDEFIKLVNTQKGYDRICNCPSFKDL